MMTLALRKGGIRVRFIRGHYAVYVTVVCCSLGWVVTRIPVGHYGERALLIVLVPLSCIAFTVALRGANLIGFVVGIYLLGIHEIGWTIPNPGRILAAIEVTVAFGLVACGIYSSRGRESRSYKFPLLLGPLLIMPPLLSTGIAGDTNLIMKRVLLVLIPGAVLFSFRRASAIPIAWGLVAGTTAALVSLLVSGIIAPLDTRRFGGGTYLLVHPNLLGLAAWTAAIAWLALPGISRAARIPGFAVCATLIVMSDSRSSIGAFILAIVVIVWALHRRSRNRRSIAENTVITFAFVLLAIGGTALIAREFILVERAPGSGILSERPTQWRMAFSEYSASSLTGKLLGNSGGGASGGLGNDISGVSNVAQFTPTGKYRTVDSAIPSLLLRSGALGILIGAAGLIGVLRAFSRSFGELDGAVPCALLAGAVATIPVESWFFSAGSLWIWIAAAGRLLEKRLNEAPR